ncbi:hypothetical protein [Chryseobacterium sp.]|uniref:hypothetical protein n=1 Tax=Chryseobacterium sp. TaxID=1871047 RepID=UPI0028971DDC|nr:hypothetical protein [Chryseobacterium sp.]
MMRKKISWLFLLTVFLSFCLHSCRSEDLLQDQPSNEYLKTIANGQYSSKSLWKEDEKYIRNIKKIYEENQTEIQKTNGVPYWDYATTMDHFDESFLIVPIVSGNKVIQTMQVPKVKNKVYFVLSDELQNIAFFQNLIFSDNLKKPIDDVSDVHSKLVCITRTVGMWYPDDEGNSGSDESGHWEYMHVTTCKIEAADMDQCTGLINQYGECTGEGGGYDYPGGGGGGEEPEDEGDPCEKVQRIGKDAKTKNLMNELKSKTTDTKEHGYVLATGSQGTVFEFPIQGQTGQAGINFSLGAGDKIDGYIHSHYTGLLSIFSPDDIFSIATFFKNNAIKNMGTFVIGVTTASNTQYMMVIDDPAKFANFANGLFNGNLFDDLTLYNYTKMYNDLFKITPSNSTLDNEKNFLQYIESSESGLKVLKGSSDMQNWSLIELDQNNNIIPTNCN